MARSARTVGYALLLGGASGVAHAGEYDAEVSADVLATRVVNEDVADVGEATIAEVGMRLRGGVTEGAFGAAVDYQGREPIPGEFSNSAVRLLYAGELSATTGAWSFGAGRFLAPSVILLPVDGARAGVSVDDKLSFALFAGRRGVTTSRRNVPFDRLLPAAGASGLYLSKRLVVEAVAAWAGDEAVWGTGSSEFTEDWTAGNGRLRLYGRPNDLVAAGGDLALAQHATYLLGPATTQSDLQIEALGLWSAVGWVDWRPRPWLRLDHSAAYQAVQVWRAGVLTAEGEELLDDLEDPNFFDNRARAELRAGLGRVRGDVRFRMRHDRQELRYGLDGEANRLGLDGLFVRGRVAYDDILPGETTTTTGENDRVLWSASAGLRRDAFDVEAGAAVVTRAAGPVSGLAASSADEPSSSADLSPFVLEAQDTLFLRSFYGRRSWFAGIDVEKNIEDAEFRVMLQAGVLAGGSW